MNAITKTTRPARLPAPVIDRAARDDLAVARNLLVRDYPSAPPILEAPLPAEMRSRLATRQAQLDVALSRCPRSDLPTMAAAVSGLLGAFGGGSGNPEAVTSKYVQVLEDLPLWAVIAACRSLERGEVDGVNLDFRPSAPRVRQVVCSLMEPWNEESVNLRQVLLAPALEPQDEAMRKRIGSLLTGLSKDLRASAQARQAPPEHQESPASSPSN